MSVYQILNNQIFSSGKFSLIPIRIQDRYQILKWRNEQMYHLRQQKALTLEQQDKYFREVIAPIFTQPYPTQVLFSYVEDQKCIGYGGLVHINWADLNAEVSFLMDTSLEKEFFEFHWGIFLSMIKEIAFKELKIHKIYTYAFDLRPRLYEALEKAGFRFEARLKDHCFFDGQFIDVVIHSLFYPKIIVREAILNDTSLTFQWANNKTIRQYSHNQAFISWDNHKNWFKKKIEDFETCQYYIMEFNGIPVGSIRFDIDNYQCAKVNYLLHPDYHGKGFGKCLLEKGIEKLLSVNRNIKNIIAIVHRNNIASVRLFKKFNFSKDLTKSEDFIHFELRINEITE